MMMRTVWRAAFVCLIAGALAVGAIVLGVLEPRPLEADEAKRVRLLVKCDQDELTQVLAALAKTKAEVWDLKTMQRLAAAPLAPKPTPQPVVPGPVPPLRDAGKVLEEILAAVATVRPATKSVAPQVTEMVVLQRRASFKLSAASSADIDRVRQALEGNAWLKARLTQVAPGAVQRLQTGRFQAALSIMFVRTPEPGIAVHLTSLDSRAFEKATRSRQLTYMYAGAVQQDPNRKAGHMTTSREYTFQAAQLSQLRGFLAGLPKAQAGLVAYELRWKLGGRGVVHKPVVRVGGRAPTP